MASQQRKYVSPAQQQLLIKMVGDNYANLTGKNNTVQLLKAKNEGWYEISTKCNSLGPSVKTPEQWKKCWFDLKTKSKTSLQYRILENNFTTHTSQSMIESNSIKDQILKICQQKNLDGSENNICKSETSLDIYDNIHIKVENDISDSDQNTIYSTNRTEPVSVTDLLSAAKTTSNVKTDERILSTDNMMMTLLQDDVDDLKLFLVSLYNPIKNLPEQAQFEVRYKFQEILYNLQKRTN